MDSRQTTTTTAFVAVAAEDVETFAQQARLALEDDDIDEAWNAVYEARVAAEVAERQMVALVRQRGRTWESIGAAYGITKQAAQQRWSDQ